MLNECSLSGNSSAESGGGINNTGTAILNQCSLSGDSACAGGGISVSGANLTLTCVGGVAGLTYTVLTSTNVALPLGQWTNVLSGQAPVQFYLLQVP